MSNQNWWAQKLGNNSAPLPPATQPRVAPQPATYAQPQQQYPPSQQVTPQAERCPGCGSGNYGGGTPESRKRCYDCGYPVVQSGSGLGKGVTSGPQASGPVQASIQVPTGGWNPTTIIGKLE
jgi:hypothetical protein